LVDAYRAVDFTALEDEAFMKLVLARIIEPTSKADTIRVLEDVGIAAPHLNTLYAALRRCQERDYRDVLDWRTRPAGRHRGHDHVGRHDPALRERGRPAQGRDEQGAPGRPPGPGRLLVDPAGFPLEVHLFEGNKAETTTLIPVLTALQQRHGVDLVGVVVVVVVADAGMLSAANLNALEDAGFSFIVGSRLTKAPYDLADHFPRKGNYFEDGQILESTRVMGTGKAARERRIV
jgi:hypothetical protein